MEQGMKVETRIFFFFLNSEFSFNNPSIITKFLQEVFETLPEGSMSQNIVSLSFTFYGIK